MELSCRIRACRQEPQGSRKPPRSQAHAALLLLLLLRPLGSLDADDLKGAHDPLAPSTAAPSNTGTPCAPNTPCPLDKPQLSQFPRGGAFDGKLLAKQLQSSAPQHQANPFPACGTSQEADLTLRYPEAMARRWPWMASVRANGTHICAGTIIASQWVLTVAHCLIQHGTVYSVRVGIPWINQMSPTSSEVLVSQVIVNNRYRARRYWSWMGQVHNIGLLKLQRELNYSSEVWPICLPGLGHVLKDGSRCTVTGWGRSKVNGTWPQSQTLQEKDVTILNTKACDSFYHKFSKIPSLVRVITSQMICVQDSDREQFCYETSGEPLVCFTESSWYLVGVVSWGPGCSQEEAPPVFLRVASYQYWIWDRLSGQTLPCPSRALLLALPLPLSLLAAL
ncbi:PREDICTED: probable threonine protease PRSS50 [Condylura cristata]|uniref:probable threonine protease PRSS50 n=1 Tax=Condylura cristata TaxID=143302 RepID=UPI0003344801|nr:PREDICTED: probable threonine protease PRSS50 [Condylura cristata]